MIVDRERTPMTTAPATIARDRLAWETPVVGNPEDALAAEQRLEQLAAERKAVQVVRREAILKMRTEDGMTYRAIAALLGMTERNVHLILKPSDKS